jgi:hypothetical protein
MLSIRLVVLVMDHSSGIADSRSAAAAQQRMNTPQLRMTAGHEEVATAAVAAVAAGCTALAAANGATAAHSAATRLDLRSCSLDAFVSLQVPSQKQLV